MFVDASAIVAIIVGEPGADQLADRVEAAESPITSPIAIFETVAAISRIRTIDIDEATDVVAEFLETARIRVVPVTHADAEKALDAFSRYGKGRGHPAQLNLGDCFAYAAASNHRRPLLFKGDDFSKTDIRSASRTH